MYQEQIFKRKIALKMLHAQINPHFLYNTLDSISWMVETGRRDQAVELLESLSTIFRVTLSGGRDMIKIGEEAGSCRELPAGATDPLPRQVRLRDQC